jgi:hypothetical protein
MIEYPMGFPPDCQEAVEKVKTLAERDFRLTNQDLTLEKRALKWVCRVLGAFAQQARGLVVTKRGMSRFGRQVSVHISFPNRAPIHYCPIQS